MKKSSKPYWLISRPFKADKRKVIGLGIELDEEGKGILDWKRVGKRIRDASRYTSKKYRSSFYS